MTLHLSNPVLRQLMALSLRQQRPPEALLEEALRWYLGSALEDDLSAEDVGRTQLALVPELGGTEE
ncbi:MAG: hypothetical protein IT449_17835 [Phycisphaerales bacterium]|nr:hypothetical protein [Phycisphaerales bacterium]